MKKIVYRIFVILNLVSFAFTQNGFETDTIKTSSGDLTMTFIGHGSLLFEFNGLVIHIDPSGRYADYSAMPKADIILVTHHHGDHFDTDAIDQIMQAETDIIWTETCAEENKNGIVMKNGDVKSVKEINIEAVPAYNIVHKRDSGKLYHPKGNGNGYVITFGDTKIYVAGDTENVPEMKKLTGIDFAFLPMNLPYTMTPEMVNHAVRMFNPKVLYPYHFGDTNVDELIELLRDKKDCEIRVRKLR
ncbi:MAG: MBL fold metallo-hydrolase [Candidatus Marinimicrobia bacterium]|nr:MBL fold metallo-hydrolase [Candidatus Neomarinimicrobiota bacterium]